MTQRALVGVADLCVLSDHVSDCFVILVLREGAGRHHENFVGECVQEEELERRWQAFERNPDEGEPWEDVKKSLLSD